ncbi:MAG: methionine--tRNA ligase [Alphaproteobacteria bacterium HGW-Alphaproteobacteria-18]|nr:MAG: methionine--tRNA ligase [Alphaproteobacteria bacterium HGW-Alphaproteobacteria-18]
MTQQRRILITSALPYINGVKHLGNLAGSMLPADVYARVMRLLGHDVTYICATDEHGTPAELAAQAAGMSVQAYCDEQYEVQRKAGEGFNLSFDWFGRTSRPANHKITQHLAQQLEKNGLIEVRTSKQVYAVDDGRFLPDRYVEGTCPHCGYEKARGDQCDSCGRLLDPTDLLNPYSSVSGSRNIEVRDTDHLYLLQTGMQDRIRDWVNTKGKNWPSLAVSIANKWLDEGLIARAITRDLSWGVKVTDAEGNPRPGFENKVFYVWFDAPIGYISATQEWAEATGNDWERLWLTDKGADATEYVQFMGKDNVAFHTVSFPVTLLGSGEPWKTVDKLKAFNWVTWYGGKFSTSQKRGVFMDQALSLLPSDYWRWYLISNAPEGSDAAFTWEGFQAAVNSDLANVLGNFINRITKYCAAKFDGKVPETGTSGEAEAWMANELAERLPRLVEFYEAMEFRKAAAETRAIWAAGNEYLTKAEPWVKYKNDVDAAAVGVRAGINLAAIFGIIAQPIIPDAAKKILDALGIPEENRKMPDASKPEDFAGLLDAIPRGHAITPPDVLFQKIEDTQIAEWTAQFGGGKE